MRAPPPAPAPAASFADEFLRHDLKKGIGSMPKPDSRADQGARRGVRRLDQQRAREGGARRVPGAGPLPDIHPIALACVAVLAALLFGLGLLVAVPVLGL